MPFWLRTYQFDVLFSKSMPAGEIEITWDDLILVQYLCFD